MYIKSQKLTCDNHFNVMSPVVNLLCIKNREMGRKEINTRRMVTAGCQQAMMPNIQGDLQNVINVLCNKVSIFVVIWSRMTFTVIGTATLKAADQSTD